MATAESSSSVVSAEAFIYALSKLILIEEQKLAIFSLFSSVCNITLGNGRHSKLLQYCHSQQGPRC